jgi:hypothetical protein
MVITDGLRPDGALALPKRQRPATGMICEHFCDDGEGNLFRALPPKIESHRAVHTLASGAVVSKLCQKLLRTPS